MFTVISHSQEPPRKRQKKGNCVKFAELAKFYDYVQELNKYAEDDDEHAQAVAPELVVSDFPTKEFDFQMPTVRISNQLLLVAVNTVTKDFAGVIHAKPIEKTTVEQVFQTDVEKSAQSCVIDPAFLESVDAHIAWAVSRLEQAKCICILPSTVNIKPEFHLEAVRALAAMLKTLHTAPCADAV